MKGNQTHSLVIIMVMYFMNFYYRLLLIGNRLLLIGNSKDPSKWPGLEAKIPEESDEKNTHHCIMPHWNYYS